ncbi:MAG: tetratricopeptide repeat protein, partial [Anaerolineae bacterium]
METRRLVEQALRRHERGRPDAGEPLLLSILSRFPRHQAARMAMGRILEETGREAEAASHYRAVVATDPTHASAAEALHRLAEGSDGSLSVPDGLAQAEVAWREGRGDEVESVLASLAASHPNLVRVQLMLGDLRLRAGDWVEGARRFHIARELDPSLVAARSLFVERGLYPEYLATAPTMLPMEVGEGELAAHDGGRDELGEMPEPEAAWSAPSPQPASAAVEERPDRLIPSEIDQPEISPSSNGAGDGDLTSSLAIVSSRAQLVAAFGEEGRIAISEGLSDLTSSVRRGSGLDAHLLLVDDPDSLAELGLTEADPEDPASIARLLADLESRLGETGHRADYLLLVGGDSIVPFFRIPNPSDDGDEQVLSDAPYSSRTGNYLLPDRAVGRIPDLGSSEALTDLIRRTAAAHRKGLRRGGRLGRLFSGHGSKPLAVSAGVWRDASAAVMRALGDGRGLQVSPPFSDQEFLEAYDRIPSLAYFNLHGVAGSPYWYGHGSADEEEAPVFPIALTPLNLNWADPTEAVVFSEACYGADIVGRSIQDSVALAFLASGARGFIGS